ncbi:MAG: glycine C-acetyltransferase [Spirochaetales bacterium]|nr:glycine C-acetyltransferase [Spirochaetales bacterium]
MFGKIKEDLRKTLSDLTEKGLYKEERIIAGPQGGEISLKDGSKVLNFCSNNYLGLANHREIIKASEKAMKEYGYGLSSVRFICGTQEIHKKLENKISDFLGTEDTILYAACFDANGGVFEPLLGEEDAIISDRLNHASIIDGVRLCKARRFVYDHSNMVSLEEQLQKAAENRYRLICTDGVFSMDGDIALVDKICDLADKYDALVMVDDSHGSGYIGETGRGTHEYRDAMGRVDIITTTFGKALGGANGGCTSGRKEIIEMLRQRSRPYLFSNTLAPGIAGAAIRAIELLSEEKERITRVKDNGKYFRTEIKKLGFDVIEGETAIVPVMLYDEKTAVKMAAELLNEGIYVIGFAYPVVPMGKARIRVQLSAAHSKENIEKAISAFKKVGKTMGVI